MNGRRERRERPPADWQEVHAVHDAGTGIVVRVLRDMASRMPKFNFEVGKQIHKKDGESFVGRRIPIFVNRTEGKVELRDGLSNVIGKLTGDAESWVLRESQRLEDEFQASRERERFERHEPRQPVMRQGKTDRKRRNRAARRAAKGAPE